MKKALELFERNHAQKDVARVMNFLASEGYSLEARETPFFLPSSSEVRGMNWQQRISITTVLAALAACGGGGGGDPVFNPPINMGALRRKEPRW